MNKRSLIPGLQVQAPVVMNFSGVKMMKIWCSWELLGVFDFVAHFKMFICCYQTKSSKFFFFKKNILKGFEPQYSDPNYWGLPLNHRDFQIVERMRISFCFPEPLFSHEKNIRDFYPLSAHLNYTVLPPGYHWSCCCCIISLVPTISANTLFSYKKLD